MKKRLGGNQEERMIRDKYKTLQKALLYSYQGADVQKEGDEPVWRALINPDKNKMDYDDKIISIDYKSGYKAGDIFQWIGTNTYWLIYLQELTEDAYFRAEIRRCKYQIQWVNKETKTKENTWAYVRGPVETKINYVQKAGISVDQPNWSLELYVPNNEITKNKFQRYEKFMLDGTTWEIQAIDRISAEGIIQVTALEYFTNPTLDSVEENLNDAFVVLPKIEQDESAEFIIGPGFIKPHQTVEFAVAGLEGGTWSFKESKRPISATITSSGGIELKWESVTSGSFTLQYILGDEIFERVIVVESLF